MVNFRNWSDECEFLSLSKDERKLILGDNDFRLFLLEDESAFSSFLKVLDDDCLFLFDDDFANMVVDRGLSFVSVLMMCDNTGINSFLSKDVFVDFLYNNIDDVKFFLSSKCLNEDFTKAFFDRILARDESFVKYIVYFDMKNHGVVLKDDFSCLEDRLHFCMNNLSEDFILPIYLDLYDGDEEFLSFLKDVSKRNLFLMFCEYFFNLSPYEVKIKLKSILDYVVNGGDCVIPVYRVRLYSLLFRFDDISIDEAKELFDSLGGVCLEKDFEDVSLACYNQLCGCLIDDFSDLKDDELSKIYDSDVYRLDGEEFFMLVHSTRFSRNHDVVCDFGDKKRYSCSLISDEHLLTYLDPLENVVLGFGEVGGKNILGMYETNAFSLFENQRVPRLYSPEVLIENTRGFNEIICFDDGSFKPSYVVCFDEVKPGDLKASLIFGDIPLVVIDSMAYKKSALNR